MNSASTPVVNRLILAVLSLILVCLILLVVKAYRRPDAAQAPSPEPVAVAPSPSEPAVTGPVRKPIAFVPRPGADVAPAPVTNTVVMPGEVRETVVQPVETTAVVVPPPHYTPGGAWPKTGQPSGGGVGQGGSGEGRITGLVQLLGTPPPEIPIDLGPSCGRLNTNRVTTRHYVVGPNGGLANVVVYVSNAGSRPTKDKDYPIPQDTPILDQVGCMFEPYVMTVRAGQPFRIRNSDPEMHNIHLTPKRNRERNFGQPGRGQVNTLTLDQPELFVRIKCDLHPWMFAYVSVSPDPFVAITDTNGNFALPPGLPAGNYMITAAHLKAGFRYEEIALKPGESKSLTFQYVVPDPSQTRTASSGRSPVNAEP